MALLAVAEALAQVLAGTQALPAEMVPLRQATGRVLADDLAARRTQPPAAVSAMDGYAVRAADVAKAPVTLRVVAEVPAGHPLARAIKAGECARIFTGGIMPAGTDAVVIQELTVRDGDSVKILRPVASGRNVRAEGLDFRQGMTLLRKGARLSERDVMLAAAMNHPALPVHRRPRVAVLGTGDELVPPGSALRAGDIVYSNGYALLALAEGQGAETLDLGIARDRIEDIAAAVTRARQWGADVLVTSGGASVGERDLVQQALGTQGLRLSFWRIALRPGRPMLHGRLGPMHVLGVPGNPASSYVCAVLFLVPLVRRLAGRADQELGPTLQTARLGRDLPANDERADYLRATLAEDENGLVATPLPDQDSSLMLPLARADCLLVREPNAPAAAAGSPCVILKLRL
ncbi:MAG: molybdopterin molybdotransferase MoeA [Pseudolabrys sp.]|nr:molybdopterin molybdotransferase MoeA [Pseudolabrys sp.]